MHVNQRYTATYSGDNLMIEPAQFLNILKNEGVTFYTGVPDSLLKNLINAFSDLVPERDHVISVNEGSAVAIAIGKGLATNEVPVVYLQNSGLGNIVNPIVSLASDTVYGVPILLIIGWRGEPGTADEPQHQRQGDVTLPMLDAIGVPYQVLEQSYKKAESQIKELLEVSRDKKCPVALVVRKNTFSEYPTITRPNRYSLSRESVIHTIVQCAEKRSVFVASTGMIGRELYELRRLKFESHNSDFLTVGGMGHASQIALGIAREHPERSVFCLDGDGAALMHLGSMALIGQSSQSNLHHIVLNNGSHASVGGQPTVAFEVCLSSIALGCGYATAERITTAKALEKNIIESRNLDGVSFVDIRISNFQRDDVGRPFETPQENKLSLQNFLNIK